MDNDEEETSLVSTDVAKPKECLGARNVLCILGFLGFANVYAMRVNLSVAIVAMVNNTAIPHVNSSSADACPEPPPTNNTAPPKEGEFEWDEKTQGLILGSFFWGYIFTNIIGGRLGELVGGKIIFGIGVLITSVLTLLTPIVARTSTTLLIALRVLEGFGEGVTFPAMNSLMAKWIPPSERSQSSSLVFAGAQFGTVVSLPICGILCQSDFLGGWPSVFYVFGVCGILWFTIWMLLVSNSPENHPRISHNERIYIKESLKQDSSHSKTASIPWRHIFTSLPFWAILVAHVAQNWGFYTLLTELPTFMKNILHFDIKQNSFMSALPYLIMWIFSIFIGHLADFLISKRYISKTTSRRLFNSIGTYCPMICLVGAGYAGCDSTLVITLLTLAVGINGGIYSGYMLSHLDLAPNFAGTLMGITNTVATAPGFLAPQLVGHLISGNETIERWQIVFWISSIIYFVGNTFYILFITAEEQPWNKLEKLSDSVPTSPSQYGSMGGQSHPADEWPNSTQEEPASGSYKEQQQTVTSQDF
ncbi:unnamed protein product [Meganyctiphanes norvegica]|uniref:Sialin n=1 Tax=Meganyctiphanes norvegica TaxID=48144 RepID=A0AAV2REF9_MEGNR